MRSMFYDVMKRKAAGRRFASARRGDALRGAIVQRARCFAVPVPRTSEPGRADTADTAERYVSRAQRCRELPQTAARANPRPPVSCLRRRRERGRSRRMCCKMTRPFSAQGPSWA